MISKAAMNRRFTRGHRTGWITTGRAFLTAREGAAPPELAFLLGFIAMVAVTGFVFLGDSLAGDYTDLSERVETASTNMPKPLGGSIVVADSGGTGESGGTGNGNGNGGGNGGGNGNGKGKKK